MLLERLSADQLKRLEEQMIQAFGSQGVMGNVSLLRSLGWTEEQFWLIRNRLIDQGILEKGRGKGGSVRLLSSALQQNGASNSAVLSPVEVDETKIVVEAPESGLYEPALRVIESKWIKDEGLDAAIAEITAMQGRRETGGKWTRPDITVAGFLKYMYVPGTHFEVVTFEIKRAANLDVTAVYEALAHRRAAKRSYVLVYTPPDTTASYQPILDDVAEECERHGIGLIVTTDMSSYEHWDERIQAQRSEPDPAKLNEFLSKQVSADFKNHIVRWSR